MASKRSLYYDRAKRSALSSLNKLAAAVADKDKKNKGKSKKRHALDDIKVCLLKHDAYTMHRPVRKRFPRNPYSVNNIMDVWECDLVDVQSFAKYNDGYRYLLTVIDVFSKFLHMVPLRVKTGKAVPSAFLSFLGDKKYSKPIARRPTWVRTNRGKEFLNRPLQELLKKEGIEFQVCRDPNVKCAVVERSHRTIRDRLYKYFTHKNKYRYIDELPKFVAAYNDTVHGATGMAPSNVGESDILAIWKKMRARQSKIKTAVAKFRAGQHVRISKEKLKFAKGGEQNYTTEIFKIHKVVHRSPRPF
jgi:transposase InsO family protein